MVNSDLLTTGCTMSSSDVEEGLRLLIGLSSVDFEGAMFDNENEPSDPTPLPAQKSHRLSTTSVVSTANKQTLTVPPVVDNNDQDSTFGFAYRCSGYCPRDDTGARPAVYIIDMSSIGRGNGLVATMPIARGEVIFTEKAAVATQVPCLTGYDRGNRKGIFRVQACQNCFRSLEPISSCQLSSGDTYERLPEGHLWPVMDFDFNGGHAFLRTLRRDRYGRIECQSCSCCFCSEVCWNSFSAQLGSCCLLVKALESLRTQASQDETGCSDVQPAITLALRLFAASLQRSRLSQRNEDLSFIQGLCGNASDLSSLGLGMVSRGDNGTVSYSLYSIYSEIVDLWAVSPTEQVTHSLEFFERLASIAALNGVGFMTQSPFKPYYESLVRSASGRMTPRHEELVNRVARALGSSSGVLQRGMDRIVEERVAPQVMALFPLTSRANHSCAPNAEIQSQVFVDCHIDLVATCDIGIGEEITISYIGTGPASSGGRRDTCARQRELQSKYLFRCDCIRCRG